MCIVSFVMDDWNRRNNPGQYGTRDFNQEEIVRLKKEIEEIKKVIKVAKEYDKATGQPNCELESKIKEFKKLAKELNVDISGVFK